MEVAGGQEVSGAKRWPFSSDSTDQQVNKQEDDRMAQRWVLL